MNAGGLGDSHTPFQQVADARGVSPQQVCLAWLLATSPIMIPIPGASRPETAADSAAAADLVLIDDELTTLNTVLK